MKIGPPKDGRAKQIETYASESFGDFSKIPYELINHIYSYLPKHYLPLRAVCRESQRVIDSYLLFETPKMKMVREELFDAHTNRKQLFKRQQREINYLIRKRQDILQTAFDRELNRLSLDDEIAPMTQALSNAVQDRQLHPRKRNLQAAYAELKYLPANDSEMSLCIRHRFLNAINIEIIRSEYSALELSEMIRDRHTLDFSRLLLTRCPSNLFEALDITCFENQIMALNLSDNHLTQLPAWLQRLKFLKVLDLSNNRIVKFPPLAQLSHLGALLLTGNRIKRIPEDIASLEQLSFLDIRNNFLTEPPKIPERKLIGFKEYLPLQPNISKVIDFNYWKKSIQVKFISRNQLMHEQRERKIKAKFEHACRT